MLRRYLEWTNTFSGHFVWALIMAIVVILNTTIVGMGTATTFTWIVIGVCLLSVVLHMIGMYRTYKK